MRATVVVLLLLIAPATAHADVDLQKGIAGVHVGMTPDEAREAAGAPSKFATRRHKILGPVREWRWGLTIATFDGTGADAKVVTMYTTSKSQRTSRGVGVGSTRATVRSKVPNVRCLVEFTVDHCFVGRWTSGRVVTEFPIGPNGRVTSVVVGRILD